MFWNWSLKCDMKEGRTNIPCVAWISLVRRAKPSNQNRRIYKEKSYRSWDLVGQRFIPSPTGMQFTSASMGEVPKCTKKCLGLGEAKMVPVCAWKWSLWRMAVAWIQRLGNDFAWRESVEGGSLLSQWGELHVRSWSSKFYNTGDIQPFETSFCLPSSFSKLWRSSLGHAQKVMQGDRNAVPASSCRPLLGITMFEEGPGQCLSFGAG